MYINASEKIKINGVEQFVSIRGEQEGAPILLYLHGGPGDSALPLVLKYNKALERGYTVVVLEQRGAGKSYYKFGDDEEITIDLFVDDAEKLSKHLLDRFSQEKLYVVGHSWGSVVGLKFAIKNPSLVHTYVGCGQVVNMRKSTKMSYDFVTKANTNSTVAKKLATIDPSYNSPHWLGELLYVTRLIRKHMGSLYEKTNYNGFVRDFLTSRKYSVTDLINREKGSMQSVRRIWQELMTANFEDNTRFDFPVVFIEGRGDEHVSSVLAFEYFETIQTPKAFHWFEKSCHFPQWSDPELFNSIMLELLNQPVI